MVEQIRYDSYPISLDTLMEGIQKLRGLPQHMQGSVHDFSRRLADSLEEKLKLINHIMGSPFEVFDFNMAVLFARGAKPSNDQVIAIAKAVFGERYSEALRNYYAWLDVYVNNPEKPLE